MTQALSSAADLTWMLYYMHVAFAVQAGFVEQPEIVDFTVTIMGGPTLAGLIPSLKAWLIRFARDAIISHYVLPEQWCFRLDPVSHASHLRRFQTCVPCSIRIGSAAAAAAAAAAVDAAADAADAVAAAALLYHLMQLVQVVGQHRISDTSCHAESLLAVTSHTAGHLLIAISLVA